MENLKGIMRRPGDKNYMVVRQFVCTGYIYAMNAKEAERKAEKWGTEEFLETTASGHIDIVEV